MFNASKQKKLQQFPWQHIAIVSYGKCPFGSLSISVVIIWSYHSCSHLFFTGLWRIESIYCCPNFNKESWFILAHQRFSANPKLSAKQAKIKCDLRCLLYRPTCHFIAAPLFFFFSVTRVETFSHSMYRYLDINLSKPRGLTKHNRPVSKSLRIR